MNFFTGEIEFMQDVFLRGLYWTPLVLLSIHICIIVGKNIWRKRHGLTRTYRKDLTTVVTFWLVLWGGMSFYFSNRFHHIRLDLEEKNVEIAYYPYTKKRIAFDSIDVIRVEKPRKKSLSIREGWALEVVLQEGDSLKSLSVRPEIFDTWRRHRITRKDLLSFHNLFESQKETPTQP